MVKKEKKVERLSPRARELLDITRNRFPHSQKQAAEYLMQNSLYDTTLTPYDRQKIGREVLIRIRSSRDYVGPSYNDVAKSYGLSSTESIREDREDLSRLNTAELYKSGKDRTEELGNRLNTRGGGVYRNMEFIRSPKELLEERKKDFRILEELIDRGHFEIAKDLINKQKRALYDSEQYVRYWPATENRLGQVIPGQKEVYRDNQKVKLNTPHREALSHLEEDLNTRKKKIFSSSKLTPVIATLGLLSGIFFLSNSFTNNVTGNVISNSGSIPLVGNAIANLSTQNISLIGAGLVAIGLIAGFFWIKKKKKKK